MENETGELAWIPHGIVDTMMDLYRITANGLWAWRALRVCLATGCPIPAPLVMYLDQCAVAAENVGEGSTLADFKLINQKGGARADAQASYEWRRALIAGHYAREEKAIGLPGCAKHKTDAREKVAAQFDTTEGSVKQEVLRFRTAVNAVGRWSDLLAAWEKSRPPVWLGSNSAPKKGGSNTT